MSLKVVFLKVFNKTVFIIEIQNGKAVHVHGRKDIGFVNDCNDIVRENGLKSGVIYAVIGPEGHAVIKTMGSIPASVQQRLRNVWSFYA